MTAEGRTFSNPVIKGFHPDPSICKVGDRFYLVVSTFEYFPGIPIFTSTDLVTWSQIGHVLDRPEQVDLRQSPASGGIYAPTIRYHDGTFYVTSTLTATAGGGHFIVTATDPSGPWSDPVWVDQNGIDPSLFFEDGLVYFTSNVEPSTVGPHVEDGTFRRGIQQSLIDPATGEILEGPRFVWEGAGGRFPEAPHLFRRGDYYYMLAAEGGTEYGHVATVGRSTSPWGPFEPSPHGPVMDHRSANSPFQAVGHADFVTLDDGSWWAVALGVRPVGHWPRHLLGRETLLTNIVWTDDDWPLAGRTGRVDAVALRPALEPEHAPVSRGVDDFEGPRLALQWAFVRAPLDGGQVLSARPGWLTLQSRGRGMSDWFPCFVGRRQEDYDFVARTKLRQENQKPGDEAGLAVRVNERHSLRVAIVRTPTGNEAVIRRLIGTIETLDVLGAVPDGDVTLGLRGTPETYTFFVETPDGRRLESGELETRFMSTEFVGGFTGTFLGPFASAAPDSDAIACFDWFEYLPLDPSDGCAPSGSVYHLEKTIA